MRGKDGKLGFSEKDRKRMMKNHMAEIINEENHWNHVTEPSIIKGAIEKVTCNEIAIAIKAIKPANAVGPYKVCAEMISASGSVENGD